ncbi:cytokine receptor-like factor 3 [Chelonus insularis]|uniref:cytokine receptor-like factor 3 n=1 Tax=Chelonus insularis TaxID=460826 RepID=UPI00158EF431|nr:cytokine receptor-like factor 3 [Chelonus insularis]XP_034948759.1 cytokine receptor-like factor 3 [Chelonus insularis]
MDHENNIRPNISVDEESTDSLNSTLTDSQILDNSGEEINLNNCFKSYYVNRKVYKKELLSRLHKAQNRIKVSEEFINDSLPTLPKVEISNNDLMNLKSLPNHIEEDVKSLIVDIDEHIKKLEEQLSDLDNADTEIIKTTNRVIEDIDNTYDQLMYQIIQEINNKRELTKLEAQVFKHESLVPLKACRKEIKSEIFYKTQVMRQIDKAIKNYLPTSSSHEIEQLIHYNRDIVGIPAVPLSDELPGLTLKRPSNSAVNEVLNKIYDLGSVLRLGCVQITDIEEKPGSVYVKWNITDSEYSTEEQTYILQKAPGEVSDPFADVFETVYEGSESACFVRELSVNQLITLRVGIQSLDSAWSALRVARTRIACYRWDPYNDDFIVTNNGRIATKIRGNSSILFSQGPQLEANQIIEFLFLEVPKNSTDEEAIALVADRRDDKNLRRKGVLMVTSLGKIFMNGEEKLMQLPQIKSGERIIFVISRKNDESLRINIESENKIVTYDWIVKTPLYFATQLSGHNKWNIMVK